MKLRFSLAILPGVALTVVACAAAAADTGSATGTTDLVTVAAIAGCLGSVLAGVLTARINTRMVVIDRLVEQSVRVTTLLEALERERARTEVRINALEEALTDLRLACARHPDRHLAG